MKIRKKVLKMKKLIRDRTAERSSDPNSFNLATQFQATKMTKQSRKRTLNWRRRKMMTHPVEKRSHQMMKKK